METKLQSLQTAIQADVHLRDILNSPLKITPAVPTPDWGVSAPSAPSVPPQVRGETNSCYFLMTYILQIPMIKTNPNSSITLTIPGSVGEPHTNVTLQ